MERDLSEQNFEMSRDYLYPEVDFNFEAQKKMRTDPRRLTLLAGELEEFEKLMEQVSETYFTIKNLK